MTEFRDKTGDALKPGDWIVYGVAYGRCAGLSYGRVLEVVDLPADDYARRHPVRPRFTKLRIVGCDDEWGHGKWNVKKASFLAYSERVVRIPESCVPIAVFELLRSLP